jgi:ABC-2 type transport system ATP-binding protein
VVFQDVAVFDELTVWENIDYFCGLYIKDKDKRAEYVQKAIDLVELNKFKKFRPKKLSGGLLRRLNIACGIAHQPKLIFFDEPTVAVDPQSRNNILEGIKALNKAGATIVYTTHYMEEVDILCDRIIILDHGQIIAEGTSEALKKSIDTGEKVTVTVADPEMLTSELEDKIAKLADVDSVAIGENRILVIYKKGAKKPLAKLVDFLAKQEVEYTDVFSEHPTLNDVFLALTGKELRD